MRYFLSVAQECNTAFLRDNILLKLEEKRVALQRKRKKIMPLLLAIPLIVLMAAIRWVPQPMEIYVITLIFVVISYFIYKALIINPFSELKVQIKEALIDGFMRNYHPEVEYSYHPNKQGVEQILEDSGLIPNDFYQYNEEDVIKGETKGMMFYLSEVHLLKKSNNDNSTFKFKGLLFKVTIPGRMFPLTLIQSKMGLLDIRRYTSFEKESQFNFWFTSESRSQFIKSANDLFPFFKYLIKQQGDVRIKTNGTEILMMLSSDMKFLDDPAPSLGRSFFDKIYYRNIGKQINTLLFILESFAENIDKTEVENRLELKALEFLKLTEDNLE